MSFFDYAWFVYDLAYKYVYEFLEKYFSFLIKYYQFALFRGLLFALMLIVVGGIVGRLIRWFVSNNYVVVSLRRIEIFYVGTFYSFFVRSFLGFIVYVWNQILRLFVVYDMHLYWRDEFISLKSFGAFYQFNLPFGIYLIVWLINILIATIFVDKMKVPMLKFIFESVFLRDRWYKKIYASFSHVWFYMCINFRSFHPKSYLPTVKLASKQGFLFFCRYFVGGFYIILFPYILIYLGGLYLALGMYILGIQIGASYVLYLYNVEQGSMYNLRDMIKECFVDRARWTFNAKGTLSNLMSSTPLSALEKLKIYYFPYGLNLLNSFRDSTVNATLSALVSIESFYKLRGAFAMSLLNNLNLYDVVLESSSMRNYLKDERYYFVAIGRVLYAPYPTGGGEEKIVSKVVEEHFARLADKGVSSGVPKLEQAVFKGVLKNGTPAFVKVLPLPTSQKPIDTFEPRFQEDQIGEKQTFHKKGESHTDSHSKTYGRTNLDVMINTTNDVIEHVSNFSPDAQDALIIVTAVTLTTIALEAATEANEMRPSVKNQRARELVDYNATIQKQIDEDRIKLQKQIDEDRIKLQKQIDEDRIKLQKQIDDHKATVQQAIDDRKHYQKLERLKKQEEIALIQQSAADNSSKGGILNSAYKAVKSLIVGGSEGEGKSTGK